MLTLRRVLDGLRACLSLPRLCVAGLAALAEFALFSLSWEDPLGYLAMAVFLLFLSAPNHKYLWIFLALSSVLRLQAEEAPVPRPHPALMTPPPSA